MKNKVYVVIPTFNRKVKLVACVKCFIKQSYKNIEVVVINDGSSDGSIEKISKIKDNRIRQIVGNGNWWWTGSMKKGLDLILAEASDADYVLSMNDDCMIKRDYVKNLVNTKCRGECVVGSVSVEENKSKIVLDSGVVIDWDKGRVRGISNTVGMKLGELQKRDIIKNLDVLQGRGTLFKVKYFRKYGNYRDKVFPQYLADYDLISQLKKKGLKIVVNTKAVVMIDRSTTGIHMKWTKKGVGVKEALALLFSKRSSNNVFDWFKFLILHCPRKYFLLNMWILLKRIVAGMFLIRPFRLAKPKKK